MSTLSASTPPASAANDNWKLPRGVQIPPFRSVDEFCREKGTFALPSGGLHEWNNRMVGNLLYFQANYVAVFLLAVVYCLLALPGDVFISLGAIVVLGFIIVCSFSVNEMVFNFRRDHPYGTLAIIFFSLAFFVHSLPSLIHVSAVGCVPLLATIVHASFRVRDPAISRSNVFVRQTVMAKGFEKLNVELRQ
ncbi:hypothetical protein L596_027272 [Steinernema carpocapsae]|uniref:PRA1 family protein n=1 Tax=Steinernema carpocapsae TaxID=34508 RepID=A0A4U5M3V2_STECR|nr:hypothetical protein L596_027272 [Steinernema carpocapsae]